MIMNKKVDKKAVKQLMLPLIFASLSIIGVIYFFVVRLQGNSLASTISAIIAIALIVATIVSTIKLERSIKLGGK